MCLSYEDHSEEKAQPVPGDKDAKKEKWKMLVPPRLKIKPRITDLFVSFFVCLSGVAYYCMQTYLLYRFNETVPFLARKFLVG